MVRIENLPTADDQCGWIRNDQSDPGETKPPFVGTIRTSWTVVGAGFTGLAAARELAVRNPDRKIVLIDELKTGRGASGRNSGFVVSQGHFEKSKTANQRLYRLGLAGIESLRNLVQRYEIDCNWNEQGRLIAVRTELRRRNLRRIGRFLQESGAPFERVSGRDIFQQTGMTGYVEGIRQIDSVMVNPARLVCGLASCLPGNVLLLEQSPVLEIGKGKPVRLVCKNGTIETKKLLVTTNAHLPSFGIAANRVFPMRTFASVVRLPGVTRPTRSNDWGLTSTERVGSSFRSIAENRVLVRNTASFGFDAADKKTELARVAQNHIRSIRQRFPEQSEFTVESTWGGTIGVTANGSTFFGKVMPKVWAVAGHNGHGIAHGTTAGRLLVELAMNENSELLHDVQNLKGPSWIPKGPLLSAGVRTTVGYLNWRSRSEF